MPLYTTTLVVGSASAVAADTSNSKMVATTFSVFTWVMEGELDLALSLNLAAATQINNLPLFRAVVWPEQELVTVKGVRKDMRD
jgi:hypothetical protein